MAQALQTTLVALQGATEVVSACNALMTALVVLSEYFKKTPNVRPCPACRVPKAHHTKCNTFGCRNLKQYLRERHKDVYGTLAHDAGADKKYHKYRSHELLSTCLARLPENVLMQYKIVLTGALQTAVENLNSRR